MKLHTWVELKNVKYLYIYIFFFYIFFAFQKKGALYSNVLQCASIVCGAKAVVLHGSGGLAQHNWASGLVVERGASDDGV